MSNYNPESLVSSIRGGLRGRNVYQFLSPYRRPILQRLGAVHCCPSKDDLLVTIVESKHCASLSPKMVNKGNPINCRGIKGNDRILHTPLLNKPALWRSRLSPLRRCFAFSPSHKAGSFQFIVLGEWTALMSRQCPERARFEHWPVWFEIPV